MQKLSEMSLAELWELFPISLKEANAGWENQFNEEKAVLETLLKDFKVCIHHVGSTAIGGIKAKDIVDILLQTETFTDMLKIADALSVNGYIVMSKTETRISLNKGYTENGFADKVFHLHLRLRGDNDELYFRDYLREYPLVAREYERLKVGLAEKYKNDRDGYTQAKTEFIQKYTVLAKQIYEKRY
ncbi:MAG: GrpB family protein [Clostridia bacterium]|nr:GrpB family protein [Clostridia bacterium]